MCDDCQSYAYYLKREEDILDANRGTEIFPVYPSQLKIETGFEHLSCVKLSLKGIFRWFTECCHTPVGNTSSPRMPYVGVVHNFIDLSEEEKEKELGPVTLRIFAKFGKGPFPPGAHQKVPLRLMMTIAPFLIRGILLKKSLPNPFFDTASRSPTKEPRAVTKEERDHLKTLARAATLLLVMISHPVFSQVPERNLHALSEKINRSLPEVYDPVTKLVRTTVENNHLFYHFLLDANQAEYTFALPKVKAQIERTICSKPLERSILREYNASIVYKYENVKGMSLGEFMVRPEFCGKK